MLAGDAEAAIRDAEGHPHRLRPLLRHGRHAHALPKSTSPSRPARRGDQRLFVRPAISAGSRESTSSARRSTRKPSPSPSPTSIMKDGGPAATPTTSATARRALAPIGTPARRFDYLIANPPYGKDWKRDEDAGRAEHVCAGSAGTLRHRGMPRISDGQLLFLHAPAARTRKPPGQGRHRASPSS
jgi:hypothetical protein